MTLASALFEAEFVVLAGAAFGTDGFVVLAEFPDEQAASKLMLPLRHNNTTRGLIENRKGNTIHSKGISIGIITLLLEC